MSNLEIALEYLDNAKDGLEMELSVKGDLDGHLARSIKELTKIIETVRCVSKETDKITESF